ncbi:MAG: M28 family peptidase [Candidatus Jordarchaeaceae archaeon]
MSRRAITLTLLSLIIVLMVSSLFAGLTMSISYQSQPLNEVKPVHVPKSAVSVAYLTNQSTTLKWEKHFTNDSSQANLQNSIGFLSSLGTRHISRTECNTSADYIFEALQSYGYLPLRDYLSVIWQNVSYVTQNIYCVKPSTSQEIILLVCHYDSIRVLRIGDTVLGLQNTNCPGAVDDAAGVAILLETARLLYSVSLEKTIVFAFLSGEEGNSTQEHWFGSQQLVTQGYQLFTTQLSNIKRVVYLDTIGELPYGESNGSIGIFSEPTLWTHKSSLIGAATDLGINILSENAPRAGSISQAKKEFCSEWYLQSVLPTITISQTNWTLTTSDRLTQLDTVSIVDYTLVENVVKILTASLVREFFALPPSSPSYAYEWGELLKFYSGGVTFFEQDYTEYLSHPSSSVVIVGPGLNFSERELQDLAAINKPLICTGNSGIDLLGGLGAQLTSSSSNTDYVNLTTLDLFYHPIWENVEENITVAINQGETTLITVGSSFFSFLEYQDKCWLGCYYGHPSSKYVFYVGRDNPANLSSKAKHIISNLVSWCSKQEEYHLQLQPSKIVGGQKTNLTMAVRNALSWEVVEAASFMVSINQNGEQIFQGVVPTTNGYFTIEVTLKVGKCILSVSSGIISAIREVGVIPPFNVQMFYPPTSTQDEYLLLAMILESSSSQDQNLQVFIPELRVYTQVHLPPNGSAIIYIPAVYTPSSPYDRGIHLFTAIVQGCCSSVLVFPLSIFPSLKSTVFGYILPFAALLACSILSYRRVFHVKPPKEIQLREARRRERRKFFEGLILENPKDVEILIKYLREVGFVEMGENRFYDFKAIVEIKNKEENSIVRIFSSQRDFYEHLELKLEEWES